MLRSFVWKAHGRGSGRAISKSISKNVIAIRKNFMEKGRWLEHIGSKPHSWVLAFFVNIQLGSSECDN